MKLVLKSFLNFAWLILLTGHFYCQVNNGVIVRSLGCSVIKGELLDYDDKLKIRMYKNKTISLDRRDVFKIKLPDDIYLYRDGKYHQRKGLILYTDFALAGLSVGSSLSLAYRDGTKWELGVGAGWYSYTFNTPNNTWGNSTMFSYTLQGTGRYFPYPKLKNSPYIKGTLGYGWNTDFSWWSSTHYRNNPFGGIGFGVIFPSTYRTRLYLEVNQQTTVADYSEWINIWDDNGNWVDSQEQEQRVWINKIFLTVGAYFGK